MTYFYTSYWKRDENYHLHLAGVLAVGGSALAAYFPADADEQADWDEIAQEINGQPGFFLTLPPRLWLGRIAERSNGLTEEYGEVSQLEAASMSEALNFALGQAALLPSTSIRSDAIRSEEIKSGKADFYDLGNPLAGLLPDSLLRPGQASTTISREARVVEEVVIGKIAAHIGKTAAHSVLVDKTAADRVETSWENAGRAAVEKVDEETVEANA